MVQTIDQNSKLSKMGSDERLHDTDKCVPVLQFQTWRDGVELRVGKVDQDSKSILQDTREATTEVKESEVKTNISYFQLRPSERTAHVLGHVKQQVKQGTHCDVRSSLSWMDYRALVLDLVCDATTAATLKLHSTEKRVDKSLDCPYESVGSGDEQDFTLVFQKAQRKDSTFSGSCYHCGQSRLTAADCTRVKGTGKGESSHVMAAV